MITWSVVFRLLLLLVAISTVIDEIVIMSRLFSVIGSSATTGAVSWLLLLQLAAALAATPLAGAVIDRRGNCKVVGLLFAVQALLLIGFSFANSLFWIYAFSFALSAVFVFTGVALFKLLPLLSDASGISTRSANSLLELVRAAGTIAGPVLGGLAVQVAPLQTVLQISALWTIGAGAVVTFAQQRRTVGGASRPAIPAAAVTGLADVLLRDRMLLIYAFFALTIFSTTFSDVVFVFLVTRDLGLGPAWVGLLIGAWSVGLLLASSASLAGQLGIHDRSLAVYGTVGMGLALLATGVVATLMPADIAVWLIVGLFLVGGIGNGCHNIAVRNVIYDRVDHRWLGRAGALYTATARIATLLGFGLGGLVGANDAPVAYMLSGFFAIAAAGFGAAYLRLHSVSTVA